MPGMNNYEEKSNDALSIRNYRKYRCDLYGLGKFSYQESLLSIGHVNNIPTMQSFTGISIYAVID